MALSQLARLLTAAVLLTASFASVALAASCNCTDTPPPGDKYTCAEQYRYGQCKEDWMVENSYCDKTCGRCFCGIGCSCTNTPPNNKYDCTQQASFGQCKKEWMKKGNFCLASCGRCKVCPQAIQLAAKFPAVPDNSDPNFEIAPSPGSADKPATDAGEYSAHDNTAP